MRPSRTVAIIAVMLLAGTGVIGATSFTTATLARDTSIDVVSDANGIIALVDGNSGGIVGVDGSTGELQIDFAVGSALGVNVDARYELGDPDDPSQRAFNITNQDTVTHDLTLNYTVGDGSGVGDGQSSVEFLVFDAAGTQVAAEDEETGSATFTAASGESFAVVVIVDTTMPNVDQNSDLSGTLNVTAT